VEVRILTTSELPMLDSLAREFVASSKGLGEFDLEHFVGMWTGMIEAGIGVILGLYEGGTLVGGIGGVAFKDLSMGRMQAQEAFWFVTEESRGEGLKLLDAFEQWAKEKGCRDILVAHLADSMPERLERIYRMRGYRMTETIYRKEV
jgi:GNAT superfamily N-acetyltransferase